jgi:hypothetical protein
MYDQASKLEPDTPAPTEARFVSPLSLWISIWQRQLVQGRSRARSRAEFGLLESPFTSWGLPSPCPPRGEG